MNLIQPNIFRQHPVLQCAMTTRIGGVSKPPFGMNTSFNVGDDAKDVHRNREQFFRHLGIKLSEVAIPLQVHSDTINVVTDGGSYPECDGLISHESQVFLCVTVADCVPIFLFDPVQRIVGAIHAGWRGTSARIAAKGALMMKNVFNSKPSDVFAFIGPSADVCCYSVGEEVAGVFENQFVRREADRIFVHLKQANVRQLVDEGISPDHIEVSPLCTISESDLLHSYRRDKDQSGRMMGVIGMKQ